MNDREGGTETDTVPTGRPPYVLWCLVPVQAGDVVLVGDPELLGDRDLFVRVGSGLLSGTGLTTEDGI